MQEQVKSKPNILQILLRFLPGTIAILQLQALSVFIYTHSSIKTNNLYMIIWVVLQSIIGIFYARVSDRNRRKTVFIFVQLLGIPIFLFLVFLGCSSLASILLVAMFSPLAIAKASLLDNFPEYPPVRIVSFTYILQYLPWMFFQCFLEINIYYFFSIQTAFLLLNVILTFFFVKDQYPIGHKLSRRQASKNREQRVHILTAFFFAEAGFFFLWAVMEYSAFLGRWFSPITLATLLGIILVVIYAKIPHFSLVTLAYLGCFTGSVVIICMFYSMGYTGYIASGGIGSFIMAGIFGGIYLPLVATAIIRYYGGQHKAYAVSIIELINALAQGCGKSLPLIFKGIGLGQLLHFPGFFFLVGSLFLVSAMMQRYFVKEEEM